MTKSVWQGFGRASRLAIVAAMMAPGLGFGGCTAGDPLAVGVADQAEVACGCIAEASCDAKANPCSQPVSRCSDGSVHICLKGQVLCEVAVWAFGEKTGPKCTLGGLEGVCAAGASSAVCCTGCVTAPRLGDDYYACNPGTSTTACGTAGRLCSSCNDNNAARRTAATPVRARTRR
jgi:hypothetical protein